jgi:hypothetical protein
MPRVVLSRALLPAVGLGAGLGVLPLLAVAPAAAAAAAAADPATRGHGGGVTSFTATLAPLNSSGVRGTATATLRGELLTITISSHGKVPGLPHAQHIHIGGRHVCPPPTATGHGEHGRLRTKDPEAVAARGPVKVSLTTYGDTGAASEIALTRFPVGDTVYRRTFTVSPAVAAQLRTGAGVIEQHGVDYNHNGRYDGAARSDLDPTLPEEATAPAACGKLVRVPLDPPRGAVEAGGGGTAADGPLAVRHGSPLTAAGTAAALGSGLAGGAVLGLIGMRRRGRPGARRPLSANPAATAPGAPAAPPRSGLRRPMEPAGELQESTLDET